MMIRAIDASSVHRITSGQVVIDLQTAVKELVENSLDAGATSIDVRFHNYGLKSIEVVDNGCGIAPKDHDSIALKHYTSKLSSFEDLTRVLTFGFRGEALSSLCALTEGITVTTATCSETPMGTVIDMDRNGKVRSKLKIARQRGTTVTISDLFKPLPVRRKEFERNAKREFQKALMLLHAYALVPCALENKGVRLTVVHQTETGRKAIVFKTDGSPSIRASVLSVWGSKALDHIVDLDLSFEVETERSALRRMDQEGNDTLGARVTPVKIQGLISKFAVGAGRSSVDRQFFFINGRPYNPGKVQKAINEVYRTFNINQSPFVIANIVLPTNACDINLSPDKRTIFLHNESNLVEALKSALEITFSSARSTYDVTTSQAQLVQPSTQQAKSQNVPRILLERKDRESLRASTSSQPAQLRAGDENRTGGEDGIITMGKPHLLLGGDGGGAGGDGQSGRPPERDELELEPEPTLVAQPVRRPPERDELELEPGPTLVAQPASRPKGGNESQQDAEGSGKARGQTGDQPTNRPAPPELFLFSESDEEGNDATTRQDNDEQARHPQVAVVRRTPTTAIASTSATSTASTPTSTRVPDKPRSVQTVLNTRGAVWNLRQDDDGDGGAEAGRERKRARLSISREGDRTRTKKSFRTSLNRFLSSSGGRKALPDGDEEKSGEEGSDSSEEVDELDEEDGGKEHSRWDKQTRPRKGSQSSQVTVVVLSDEERAMDVDEPPSTITKRSRVVSSHPSTGDGTGRAEVDARSDDDWGFSSTLVGTYVPPAGKTTEPCPSAPSARPLAEPDADAVTLRVNLIDIGTHYLDVYNRVSSHSESPSKPMPSSALNSAISSANLETAAEDAVASAALSRIISKADFEHMTVVGQFNLGFILVRKSGDSMDDLFIVDQHAADEKWNFETLQESTVIASQKLFRPRELQFTAADEMLAIENMDVLKRNGFELERVGEQEDATIQDEDEEDGGAGSASMGGRLRLVAQPMSKDTVFDFKDLEELLHLMQDCPRGTMVRCSKARAMFAMRACRRSVMVGKALDRARMTAIVRHMGTMDQPWNCPHGRPTMRHLSDLRSFGRYEPSLGKAVDWVVYGGEESRI